MLYLKHLSGQGKVREFWKLLRVATLLISNEVYLFSQTLSYILILPKLFANFCKISAELYRPSGLLLQIWTNLKLLKNNFFFFFFFLNNFKIRQKVGGDETDLRRRRIAACRLLLKGLHGDILLFNRLGHCSSYSVDSVAALPVWLKVMQCIDQWQQLCIGATFSCWLGPSLWVYSCKGPEVQKEICDVIFHIVCTDGGTYWFWKHRVSRSTCESRYMSFLTKNKAKRVSSQYPTTVHFSHSF